MELFQFTNPATSGLKETLTVKQRVNGAGEIVGLTMALDKRKAVAGRMGLAVKDAKVTEACRAATDTLLQIGLAEISMAASKGTLTGARLTRSKSKGGQRIVLAAVTPEIRTVSQAQMEVAFASLSETEKQAFLAKVSALKESARPAVNV